MPKGSSSKRETPSTRFRQAELDGSSFHLGETLVVPSVTVAESGIIATLNRDLDPTHLNVYDTEPDGFGPPYGAKQLLELEVNVVGFTSSTAPIVAAADNDLQVDEDENEDCDNAEEQPPARYTEGT